MINGRLQRRFTVVTTYSATAVALHGDTGNVGDAFCFVGVLILEMRLSVQSLKDSIIVVALDAGIYTKILGRHLQARSCSSQVESARYKLTKKLKLLRFHLHS